MQKRPDVIPGLPIKEYSRSDLVALAKWILSDTLLRTDDELLCELRLELGFKRGGSRINAALQDVIFMVRAKGKLV